MFSKDDLVLMMSAAFTAPYLDIDEEYMISGDEALRLVDMYNDEVVDYIKMSGVKTLPSLALQEDVHILYNGTLIYVGRFSGGSIPSQTIFRYKKVYRKIVLLHTHPVPLPIPTPEDLISMYQIGYDIECVLSRVDRDLAKMVCVKPVDSFYKVAIAANRFAETFYRSVDKYVVVEGEDGVMFIPYPSKSRLDVIEKEFISILSRNADISIVELDMTKNEFAYNRISQHSAVF